MSVPMLLQRFSLETLQGSDVDRVQEISLTDSLKGNKNKGKTLNSRSCIVMSRQELQNQFRKNC